MNRTVPSRGLTGLPKSTLRAHLRARSYYTTTRITTTTSHQQPQLNSSPSHLQKQPKTRLPLQPLTQRRPFLSSFLPQPPKPPSNNSNNNNNGNNGNTRTLTATRTLSYPPTPLFSVISSVDSYSSFLPFLTASTVTARDPETGYPSQAYLTVGYGPLSETFTSKVDCDDTKWIVEARSGERFIDPQNKSSGTGSGSVGGGATGVFPGADEGIFEFLSTRWELVPVSGPEGGRAAQTTVKLEIRFEFKNQLYAGMMSAVEGQMAGVMIEAFERRIREVHG
ncbi:hypothetical protein BJX70DRAFT_390758 [Aspergillus crustosus]